MANLKALKKSCVCFGRASPAAKASGAAYYNIPRGLEEAKYILDSGGVFLARVGGMLGENMAAGRLDVGAGKLY